MGGGGGGGVQARAVFQCTDQKNGVRTPTTFDINDVMGGGGGGGGGYNETFIFSKIVWRRPPSATIAPRAIFKTPCQEIVDMSEYVRL